MKEKDIFTGNLAASNTNVSWQKQGAETRLREDEELYQAVFGQTTMGIVYFDARGQWFQINQKFCDIVGYSRLELFKMNFQDITHPDDLSANQRYFQQLLTGEQSSYSQEKRFLRKDGSPVWVKVILSRYESSTRNSPMLIGFVEDIHAQKQKEIELVQQIADGQQEHPVSMVQHNHVRHTSEPRMQRALDGLLKVAEALIKLPDMTNDIGPVGLQLAEVTTCMLDCQWVGMYMIDAETQIVRPFALVGMDQDQGDIWLNDRGQGECRLEQLLPPAYIERLRHNEVVVIDTQEPGIASYIHAQQIKTLLVAPIYVGVRLMGLIGLYYDQTRHYTSDELAMAATIARLATLLLERQRLLEEWTEAQGHLVALRDANGRMEEFLGIASHELRTPLTTIKANTQLAMRRLKGLLAQSESLSDNLVARVNATHAMLERAERQIGVLNRLVSDMIDISRIQTGKLQIQLRHDPCDLFAVVKSVVQEQQRVAPERTINMSLPQVEQLFVMADPDRIKQVFANYLSNALKYSGEAQPVLLQIALDTLPSGNTNVIASVHDHGQGLADEELPHVWECFYQSPDVRVLSGSGVGLGLGLYISQALIERHGGQVGVTSRRGEGSTFWFTLPLVQV